MPFNYIQGFQVPQTFLMSITTYLFILIYLPHKVLTVVEKFVDPIAQPPTDSRTFKLGFFIFKSVVCLYKAVRNNVININVESRRAS